LDSSLRICILWKDCVDWINHFQRCKKRDYKKRCLVFVALSNKLYTLAQQECSNRQNLVLSSVSGALYRKPLVTALFSTKNNEFLELQLFYQIQKFFFRFCSFDLEFVVNQKVNCFPTF